jgi:hypothetical protein
VRGLQVPSPQQPEPHRTRDGRRRSSTPSLPKARSRWVFTIDSPTNKRRSISAFVQPSATSRSTAVSRSESRGRAGFVRGWSISRAATGKAKVNTTCSRCRKNCPISRTPRERPSSGHPAIARLSSPPCRYGGRGRRASSCSVSRRWTSSSVGRLTRRSGISPSKRCDSSETVRVGVSVRSVRVAPPGSARSTVAPEPNCLRRQAGSPMATTCPLATTASRSASASASSRWCVVSRTVVPSSASSRIRSQNCRRPPGRTWSSTRPGAAVRGRRSPRGPRRDACAGRPTAP